MALTANRYTKKKVGDIVEYPVAASTQIFGGGIVCVDANGYAVPGADSSGLRCVGIAEEAVDNNPGNDGDKTVRVRRKGMFLLASSGLSQASVGDIAEVVDDQTVIDGASTSNHVKIGEIVQYVSATSCWVHVGRIS
jgi:hypothetical protein